MSSLSIELINMKMLVFFLTKCVRTAANTMAVDRKNQKALALLLWRRNLCEMLRTQAGLPTEFAVEPTTKMKSLGKFELFA